jgi:hypothetical protein
MMHSIVQPVADAAFVALETGRPREAIVKEMHHMQVVVIASVCQAIGTDFDRHDRQI